MLINKRNEYVISKEEETADSLLKRMRGLMFRRRISKPLLFILPKPTRRQASIHMFFVFFPIDLVYLDENWRVVDIYVGVRPFTVNITPKKEAKYILEMEKGTVARSDIRLGDLIVQR